MAKDLTTEPALPAIPPVPLGQWLSTRKFATKLGKHYQTVIYYIRKRKLYPPAAHMGTEYFIHPQAVILKDRRFGKRKRKTTKPRRAKARRSNPNRR